MATYNGPLSPEYALLGMLAQQPAHGYDLHRRLVIDLGRVWHTSLSQIYNILKRLETQGYIAGDIQEQKKLPARRMFHLTTAGRQRFEPWLHRPSECSVRAIRVEFVTRLYFAQAIGVELADQLVESQTEAVMVGLSVLEAAQVDTPPEQVFNRLGLDLRIRQLRSVLDWLAECRQAITTKH